MYVGRGGGDTIPGQCPERYTKEPEVAAFSFLAEVWVVSIHEVAFREFL